VCVLIKEQIDVMKPGTTVELRNAKVEMFNMGFMRLVVDRWVLIDDPSNIRRCDFVCVDVNLTEMFCFDM
jgi:hypothetical protein